jgi:lipoate-protein ligase A
MNWTLHCDPAGHPGWYQMALDQALLDHCEQTLMGAIRLYRWAPHCLSFGRHEPALRRYDRPALTALGLDTVRRPTGGRAVWHARELTYSIIAPTAALGGLRESSAQIHGVIAEALRTIGVAAELAPVTRTPALHSGACFQGAVGGEITVGGRKLLGSAQLRQGEALLQHGSLLLEDDQSLVTRLSRGAVASGGEVTLTEVLGRQAEFDEIAALVGAGFRRWLGPSVSLDPVAADQLVERHANRFRDPDWTWRR